MNVEENTHFYLRYGDKIQFFLKDYQITKCFSIRFFVERSKTKV